MVKIGQLPGNSRLWAGRGRITPLIYPSKKDKFFARFNFDAYYYCYSYGGHGSFMFRMNGKKIDVIKRLLPLMENA